MRYAYYPGCSLHSTGCEFDLSLREISSRLDVELEEIKGWICCGSTPAHSVSEVLALALPVANLQLVEKMKLEEAVVPCASCFRRLKAGHHEYTSRPDMRETLDGVTDGSYAGTVNILHPLGVFSQANMLQKIAGLATRDLSHLKVACYYGCLLTRPPKVMEFDRHEYPESMDQVLHAAGVSTLDWDFKTMCCGAAFALTETDIVLKLTGDLLDEARAVGANAIAVACPLCHANLDGRQIEIEKERNTSYGIPTFYFTQLLGLAMGIAPEALGIDKHLTEAGELLARDTEEREQEPQAIGVSGNGNRETPVG